MFIAYRFFFNDNNNTNSRRPLQTQVEHGRNIHQNAKDVRDLYVDYFSNDDVQFLGKINLFKRNIIVIILFFKIKLTFFANCTTLCAHINLY